ncbi:penicillin-binding protein 1C [Psychrobium sp. 1_MG-2023]|uniref:penicillin-binding protein 1C n=1 Tax=Psychrobium sp. 1_MG-2023 TaxID=3062624 RepID=UPI000C345147|nr:penicillin-binding protein 1C [Psychrobium sp. 1_MG-2023]MDP2561355.1 penicillin-binding protein 1C [Psychrobium sp. 1_MG-2023]PKF54168.1 penicillin-binding protein 1C [Alteromonadales bacterium alter-6D02]
MASRNWIKARPFTLMLLIILVFNCAGLKLLDVFYPLQLPEQQQQFARVVVDQHNIPLRTFADKDGIWRYPVTIDEVSPRYIQALLNYEDRWFWYHPGVNPFSILRAAKQNIVNGRIISGGSTLSMQVSRILYPHSRSLWGKTTQLLRTLQLEWHLEKRDILEIYLNNAPFGGTIEGVQAASYTYLNKSAKTLTHAEAALLAVLPQAPTRYRPDLHNQAAQQARNKVLKRMADFGVWSQETIEGAMLEQVFSYNFRPQQLAPLLSRRLLARAMDQAVVKSTIDSDLQQGLAQALASYMTRLPQRSSGAIMVVDNHTSAVKAYIGTADFANSSRFGYVDMVQATRSPGSTLKPFLYALALDEGLIHSHSLLADVPREWGDYRPSNFSGLFHGPVSAHDALQRSLNIPAVDLLERYGANRFVARLQNAGLALTIPQDKPNLAVILGGAGTSLEQLVQSYSAFANQGQVTKLRFLQSELQQPKVTRNLLSPASAWIVQQTLSGISRPDSINTLAATRIRDRFAWKTGTSYGFRDSWAIGLNQDYTIGVWLGRPDGTAMAGHYGRVTAGPLLFTVVDQLIHRFAEIEQPDNVTLETICWPLGTLAKDQPKGFCQRQQQAWIIDQVIPPTWHSADVDAWQGGVFKFWLAADSQQRVSMSCAVAQKVPKQVALWPKILEPWISPSSRRERVIPKLDPRCANEAIAVSATLKITGVEAGSIYRSAGNSSQSASIWLKSVGGSGEKHWYINGQHRYTTSANGKVEHVLSEVGQQQIIVQDQLGNTDVISIMVQ